jgi:hypothetical protein
MVGTPTRQLVWAIVADPQGAAHAIMCVVSREFERSGQLNHPGQGM